MLWRSPTLDVHLAEPLNVWINRASCCGIQHILIVDEERICMYFAVYSVHWLKQLWTAACCLMFLFSINLMLNCSRLCCVELKLKTALTHTWFYLFFRSTSNLSWVACLLQVKKRYIVTSILSSNFSALNYPVNMHIRKINLSVCTCLFFLSMITLQAFILMYISRISVVALHFWVHLW